MVALKLRKRIKSTHTYTHNNIIQVHRVSWCILICWLNVNESMEKNVYRKGEKYWGKKKWDNGERKQIRPMLKSTDTYCLDCTTSCEINLFFYYFVDLHRLNFNVCLSDGALAFCFSEKSIFKFFFCYFYQMSTSILKIFMLLHVSNKNSSFRNKRVT